jgi:acyl-CoA synthetase (NDP forming)
MNDTNQALHRILNPRSIAIVGASNSFTSPATNLMASVISTGFAGKIYPIHPKEKTALGLTAYPTLVDVPGEIDLVVIVVQAKLVPGILAQCGQKGVRQAVVITAGYREMGAEGAALEKELLAEAHKNGVRFIGPTASASSTAMQSSTYPCSSTRAAPGGWRSSPRAAATSPSRSPILRSSA